MKLVALVQAMTAEQDKQFIEFITKKRWGYWHWIDGAWLITSSTTSPSATTEIRDELKRIAPSRYSYVFEVEPRGGWAGFGAKSETRDMFRWLRDNWHE